MSQCRQQLLRANQCGNTNICCNAEDRFPSKEELLAGIDAHLKHNYGVKKILQNAKANPRFSSNENRINQNQCYNMECGNSLQKMTDCVNGRVMNSGTQIGSSLYNLCNTRNSQCVYEPDLESCVDLRTAHQNTLSLKKTSPKTRALAFNKYSQWLKCQSRPSSDNKNLKIEIESQKNLNSIKIKVDPQKKGKSKSRSGSVSRKTSQETCQAIKGIKSKKTSATVSPRPHQTTKKKLLGKTASSAMKYAKLSEEIMRYTKQLKGSENPPKQCYHLPSSEIQTRDSDFSEMQNDINSMKNKARVKHRISIHNHDTYIVLNGKKSSTKDESKKIESNDRSSVKRNSSECINLSKTQIVDTRKPSIVIDDSTYVVPQNSEQNQYLILPYLANAKENLEGDQTPGNPEMSEKQQAQQRDSKVLKSMPKKDSQIESPEVMDSTGTSNPMESTWESHINQKIQYTRKDEPSNTTPLKEPNDPCTSSTVEKNSRTSASQPLRENTYVLMTEQFMESHKDAPKDTDLVTEKKRKEDYVPTATERNSNNGDQILVLRGSLNVKPNQDQQEEITLDLESLSLDLDFTNRSSEVSSPRTEISKNKYSEQKKYYEQQLKNFRNENTQTSSFQSCRHSGLVPISEGSQSRSDSDPKQSKDPKPNNVGYSSSSYQSRTPRVQVVASHNEILKQYPWSVVCPLKYASHEKRPSSMTQKLSASNTPRGSGKSLQNLPTRSSMTQKPPTSNTPRGSAKSNEYLTLRRMEPETRISMETKHPKVELNNKRIDTPRRVCDASKTCFSIHNKSTDNKYRNENTQTSGKCGKKGELGAISEVTKSRSETVSKQSQNPKPNNGCYSSSCFKSRTPRVQVVASHSETLKQSPRTSNIIPKKYGSEDHSQKNTLKRSSTMTQKPSTSNTPRGSAKTSQNLTQRPSTSNTPRGSAKSNESPRRMEPKRKNSIETKHPKVELHKTWNDTLRSSCASPKTRISIQNKSTDNKYQNEKTQKSSKSGKYSESDAISKESKSRSNSVGYSSSSRQSRSPKVPIATSCSHIPIPSPRTPNTVPKKYASEDHSSSQKNNVKRSSSTMAQKVPTAKCSAKSSEYLTPKPTEPKRRFSIETKHPTIELELENTCNDNRFGDTSLISISIHNEDNENCEKTLHLKCFPECTVDDVKTKINTKENTFILKSKIKTSVPISSSPSEHIEAERPTHSDYSMTSKTDETEMNSSPKEVSPKLRHSESRSRSTTTTDQKRFNPEHNQRETFIHGRLSDDEYGTPEKTNETIDETEMISTSKEVPPRYSESRSRSSTTTNQRRFDAKHHEENSFIHRRSSLDTEMISIPKEASPKLRYSESRSRSSTTTNQKRFDPKHIEDNTFIIETEMISPPENVPPKSRYSESRSRSSTTTNQKRFDPKHIEENSFIHEPEMISSPKEVSPKFRYSESRSRSSTTTNQKRFDPKHNEDNTFIIEAEMISTPKEVPPKSRYSESRSRSSTTTNQKRFDPKHIEENSFIHEPVMISSPKEVSPKSRYSESRYDPEHIKEKSSIHGRSSHGTEMISSTPKAFSSTTANQERLDAKHHEENCFIHRRLSSPATEMITIPKEVPPKSRYSESKSRSSTTMNQKRFDAKHHEENSFNHRRSSSTATEIICTPKELSPKFRYSESRSRSTTTTNQKRFNPEHNKQETFIHERSSDDEYAIPEKTNENIHETVMFSTPIEAKLRIVNFRSKSTATTTQTNSDLEHNRETRISTSYESLENTTNKTKTKDCNCPHRLHNNAPTYEADSLNDGDKELLPFYSQPRISKSSSEYSTSLQNELNLQGKNIRHTLSKSFEMIPNSKKSKDNDKNTIPAETLQETISRVVGADNSDSSDVNSRRLSSALEEASKLTSEVLNEIGQNVENLNRNNDDDSGRRLSAAFQRASKITKEIKQEVDKLNNNHDVRRISTALQRASVIKGNADDQIRKEVEILSDEIQAVFSQLDVDEEKPTVSSKPEVPSKRTSSNISPTPYLAKIPPINLDASSGSQSEEQTPGHPITGVPREIAELIYNLQSRVKTCDAKIKKQTEIIEQLKGESATCPKPLKEGSRDVLCTCCTCDDQEYQVENVSDSSDEIPPFTGCECMREDYYAIMRIAYGKR